MGEWHQGHSVPVAAAGVAADRHARAADTAVRVAVDDRHLHGGCVRRSDIGRRRHVPDRGRLRGDRRTGLALRPAGDEQRRSRKERCEPFHASSGTASDCTGSSVPPPASSRITCEK